MRHSKPWLGAVLIVAGLQLAACDKEDHRSNHDDDDAPAKVEHVDGSELSRVILTAKAAERLDIQTALVREAQVARSGSAVAVREARMTPLGSRRTVVPYAAVLYDARGDTWVYTNPAPLVFVRHQITVDYIVGDQAVLSAGPPVGTPVVTVGGVELFGTEFEIGH